MLQARPATSRNDNRCGVESHAASGLALDWLVGHILDYRHFAVGKPESTTIKEHIMNAGESLKTSALAVKGRTKEVLGFALRDRDMQTDGKADQIAANLRRARDRGLGALDALRNAAR